MLLDKQSICELIPHTGNMCLLESVVDWGSDSLIASSNSHAKIDNPLRSANALASINGIEYAAQTMALHASLIKTLNQDSVCLPRAGYLASVRNINIFSNELFGEQIEQSDDMLIISVFLKVASENGLTYDFLIERKKGTDLNKCINGKITIIFEKTQNNEFE